MITRVTGQKNLKIMMMIMALCGLLLAEEDVVISGTVNDNKGEPLQGVKVTLSKLTDLSMETNADGGFILTNITSVLPPITLKTSYGFTIRNNAIVFTTVSEKVTAKLSLYSINGRLVTSVSLADLHAGQQRLALPRLSSGAYVLSGTVGGESFTRSLVCTGNDQLRSKATEADGNGAPGLRKTAAAAGIVDTLLFSKEGYNTQRWPLNIYSRENIKIVLRATGETPVVYMTKKLDKEAFLAIYEAIGYDLPGEIMVKVHTGEGRASNKYYITPERMSSVVNLVNGTIVETCLGFTAAGFTRTNPAANLQLSKDHGFDTIGQGIDILDTDGEITLPVVGGTQLKGEIDVGANFKNYQSSLVISHFKGHGISGFGGAIKNVALGFASPNGKRWIHSGGKQKSSFSILMGDEFQKAMIEASKAVQDALEGNVVYINAVDNLTLECDCDPQAAPEMSDIGILGSLDPIAIDQASCDLVLEASGGQALKSRIESTQFKGLDGLKYGQEIGLGKIEYELVDIDK